MKSFALLLVFLFSSLRIFSQVNPDDAFWNSDFGAPANDVIKALIAEDNDIYWSEFGRLNYYNFTDNSYECLGLTASGLIYTVNKYGNALYIGGTFRGISGCHANYIAKYENGKWDTLGLGVNGTVNAICFDSSGNLYAGGHFYNAGGEDAYNIAMWDGTNWYSLGTSLDKDVRALLYYNGKIYAGGDFNNSGDSVIHKIACYDIKSGNWQPLGWGIESYDDHGIVTSIAVNSKGDIFAGGTIYFSAFLADTIFLKNIAVWDGKKWGSVGAGFDDMVLSLNFMNGKLYAGGQFVKSGTVTNLTGIASWDGTNWSPVGKGVGGDGTNSVLALNQNSKGELFISGDFNKVGNLDCFGIITWDGSKYINKLPSKRNGAQGLIYCMTVDKSSSMLYAAGEFVRTGNVVSQSIAKYDGSNWIGCKDGLNPMEEIYSICAYNGEIYFTGKFGKADTVTLNNVAKWIDNTQTWQDIGKGIDAEYMDMNFIYVTGTNIYVAGNFTTIGNETMNYISRWDGNKWNKLGTGLKLKNNGRVWVKHILEDAAGNIYVAGKFDTAGNVEVQNFAVWDPKTETWRNPGGTDGEIKSMYNDGNAIYLAGKFQYAGNLSNANNIAKYNISAKSWEKLGNGTNDTVTAITKQGNDIYIGGWFTNASGVPAMSVAKYSIDSSKFVSLGSGLKYGTMPAIITDMTIFKNELYISGRFTSAGKFMASNFAKWTKIPVDVKENDGVKQNEIECYPNPVSEILNIKIMSNDNQPITIDVYNQLSQKFMTREVNNDSKEIEINTHNYQNGIYFVRIGIGNIVYFKKVIVIR